MITFVKQKFDDIHKRSEERKALKQKVEEATKEVKVEEAIKTAIYKERTIAQHEREAIKNGKPASSGFMAALNKIDEKVDFKKGMDGLMGKPSSNVKPPKIVF